MTAASKAFSTLQQIKPEDLKSPKGASFKGKKGPNKKLESDKKQQQFPPHYKPSLEPA
jgi:hypothetical protein